SRRGGIRARAPRRRSALPAPSRATLSTRWCGSRDARAFATRLDGAVAVRRAWSGHGTAVTDPPRAGRLRQSLDHPNGAHRNHAASAGGTSVAARRYDAGGCGRDEAAPATLTGPGTARRRRDEEEARMGMAHGTARAARRAPAARRTLDG